MAADFLSELITAIKPKPDKKNRTYSAIVSKVDSDGVAWVYVAGSDRETPIASAASEIKRGDAVNVEWRNNKLYIAGNYSNPSAGVVRVANVENAAQVANQLAGQASESAAVAQDAADRAVRDADTAHQAANTAQASADRSLVQLSIVEDVAGTLNWISEHGEYVATTDTTVDPDKVYFELVDGDYVPIANPDPGANPAESGWYVLDVTDSQSDYIMAHLAVTSAGLWVLPSGQWAMHPLTDSDGDYASDWSKDPQNASGYKVLLSATGMTVFDGEGVAVASYGAEMVLGRLDGGNLIARPNGIAVRDGLTELATFSADGVQIGQNGYSHSTMDSNGQRLYGSDGVTQLSHIGYGEGTGSGGDISVAPYYTFGTRKSNSSIGNYSFAEGMNTTASGFVSHAEGIGTTASGVYTHAEGVNTTASGSYAHAEGWGTIASGGNSHAEGSQTTASGLSSHASGSYTIASYNDQMVIGRFNAEGNYPFVIGNGSWGSPLERKNALTVDWDGNLVCNNVGVPNYMTNPTITKSTGSSTCSVVAFSGYGKMRMLILAFTATATISSGSNVFTGTITTTSARPKIAAGGSGFYGGAAVIGNINASGDITIRICGGSVGSGGTIWVYFTYFVA